MDAANTDLTTILDNLEKIFTILAIIIGGIWAYFNFFKSRLYRIRLEPGISGKIIKSGMQSYLAVKLTLKNAGLAKVKISQEDSDYTVYSYDPNDVSTDGFDVDKEQFAIKPVLESHKWIESGETIVEEQLIHIDSAKHFAVLLEFRIVAHKISFKSNHIVLVADDQLTDN